MTDPVEVMARAAYERVSPLYGGPWSSKRPQDRDGLILDMQAALSALDAAGFAVVPKEPTGAMLEAGANRYDGDMNKQARAYRAMLSAAQVKP